MRHAIAATAALSLLVLVGCDDAPADDATPADSPPSASTDATPGPAAAGAPEAVGSITASFGGDDRTWTSLYRDADGRVASTSTYQVRPIARRDTYSLSLGGHVGRTMSTAGSFRVRIMETRSLSECPCTGTGSFEYVDDDSKLWEASGVTVTIELFYENGDGTFGAEGTFSGTLPKVETDGEPVRVEGKFDIRRIIRVGPGA